VRYRILPVVFFLALALEARGTCEIRVRQIDATGRPEKIAFRTPLRNRVECAELARMHNRYFTGTRVTSKRVSFRWEGPATARISRRARR